jgi:hypothetical protein
MRFLPLLAATAIAGCDSAPKTATRAAPISPCFAAESGLVAYGAIRVSDETHDASGKQFSFRVQGDSLVGWVRDARGEVPAAKPLMEVRFDPRSDTVSFWYASDTTTRYIFKYHVRCSELSGLARLFVTATYTGLLKADTVRRATPITKP